MKKNHIVIVSAILLISIILIVFLDSREKSKQEDDLAGELFFPQLKANINTIARIELKSNEDFNISSDGENWLVAEKDNFPADFSKIKQLAISMANLKTIEAKTKKPENYDRVGVGSPEDTNGTTKQIALIDNKGETLASLIIGNNKPGARAGFYARVPDQEQAWLLEGKVDYPSTISQWLDKRILDIPAADVNKIEIKNPKKNKLVISRPSIESNDFAIGSLPKGKKIKSQATLNQMANSLQGLDLNDVMSAKNFQFDSSKTSKSRIETKHGLIAEVSVSNQDNQHLAVFQFNYDETLRPKADDEEQIKKLALTAPDDVKKQVSELNQKTAPWVYVLPTHKAEQLSKSLEDLIE